MHVHPELILAASAAWADVKPAKSEMALARQFASDRLRGKNPPFSFTYGGKSSSELLATWRVAASSLSPDKARTERTIDYTDPATGLVVTVRAVIYSDFPTVEWTVFLKNTGSKDTPIIENLQGLDIRLEKRPGEQLVLHHNVGSRTTAEDYRPIDTPLEAGQTLAITGAGGRPAGTDLPNFNLQHGDGGLIVVLGWPGQCATSFVRDAEGGVRIVAGQEKTHFKLHPGERVRTPLIALQFWQGTDVVRAQNIWRRWMVAHSLPRPGGKPFPVVFSACQPEAGPGFNCGANDEIAQIEGCVKHGLKVDYWWRDAGWYPCKGNWWNTGTWEPDPARYPKGLREIAGAAHKAGMKLTVWFEPERCVAGTWLPENHPEWILDGKDGGLVDFGNPEAWKWVVERVDKIIAEQHIDMYRQDFNMDPLPYWQGNDAEDRQGITENHHVIGLLALWDELHRRHPGMPFDCCASGGKRNDLAMMRRGVPLSKTDFSGGTTSTQCQTYGISSWLPYYGAGIGASEDPYVIRSNFAPWSAVNYDTRRDDLKNDLIRRSIAEWREVALCFLGDFYPLTPYSLDENVWMAWQFDRPDLGRGMVQAFRRPGSDESSRRCRLQGLDPRATFTVTDMDTGKTENLTGKKLMGAGLTIAIQSKPGAALITYHELR